MTSDDFREAGRFAVQSAFFGKAKPINNHAFGKLVDGISKQSTYLLVKSQVGKHAKRSIEELKQLLEAYRIALSALPYDYAVKVLGRCLRSKFAENVKDGIIEEAELYKDVLRMMPEGCSMDKEEFRTLLGGELVGFAPLVLAIWTDNLSKWKKISEEEAYKSACELYRNPEKIADEPVDTRLVRFINV